MLISILLSVALTSFAQGQTAPPADARAQAEQLARSGSLRAALEKFQALAAQNPEDVEVRVWIARLHAQMGAHERAVTVYQSIVATHPQQLDALIGLGDALIAVDRLREAAEALTRAEALAAENPQVLAAQGRLHAKAGRTRLALAYYERAMTLTPASPAIRQEYDDLRAEWAHRVVAGYAYEHFDTDVSDGHAGFGGVNVRASDSVRVSGTVQHQRKFSTDETRGGGGVEWRAHRNLRLYAGALFGGDAEILPQVDGYGGIAYSVGRATWSFDVRVAEFEEIRVDIAGGGVRFALPQHSAAWVKYYRFATAYPFASSDVVQSWVLGASGRVAPTVSVGAEYTRGPDQLDLLTIDRTGEFEANTYSAFADFRVVPMVSIGVRYDYQSRPAFVDADVRVHRATVQLIRRF